MARGTVALVRPGKQVQPRDRLGHCDAGEKGGDSPDQSGEPAHQLIFRAFSASRSFSSCERNSRRRASAMESS